MHRGVLVAALVAAIVLTACGSPDEGALEGTVDWSSSDDPVGSEDGLAWADRFSGEIHMPDGSTLESDRSIDSFVVAGRGAYVVESDSHDLVEVTTDGARETGAHVEGGVRASADGRYLAFLDPGTPPRNDGDVTVVMTAVVVDLQEGTEVLRSTTGMGDPDEDLTVLYLNVTFGVLAVSDGTAWFQMAEGDVRAVDLGSGDVSELDDGDLVNEDNPWVQPRTASDPNAGDLNAERTWGIDTRSVHDPAVDPDPASRQSRDALVSATGAELVPRTGTTAWSFDRWLDATTVVGFADQNLEDPDQPGRLLPSSLITCTVPDGECELVPDSDDAILPTPTLY